MQSKENHSSRNSNIISDDDMVEITLDIKGDSVVVHSITASGGADVEDPELDLRRARSLQEFKRVYQNKSLERKTCAMLNFVRKIDGDDDDGWREVESRFDRLTMDTNGLLTRADFGKCIDVKSFDKKIMKERNNQEKKKFKYEEHMEKEPTDESQDFVVRMFDTISRSRRISTDSISKEQTWQFWVVISDENFDSRLMVFFDMIDKNNDRRINEDEIRELIVLNAMAIKLSNIKDKAGEYAALLMEELDPDRLGYIEYQDLKSLLLLEGSTHLVQDDGDRKLLSRMVRERLKDVSDYSLLRKCITRVINDSTFGVLAHDYKNYEVVLLVGVSDGATPMINIAKDIVNKNNMGVEEDGYGLGSRSRDKFKTRKAYFYWVTEQEGSFDWFKEMVNEVVEMDRVGVLLGLHNYYISDCYEEGDARSTIITMIQSLNHAKNGVDIVSETKVKSHIGNPNWKDVYGSIAINHPRSKIGVFYNGSPQVGKQIKQLALDFSLTNIAKFEFHHKKF